MNKVYYESYEEKDKMLLKVLDEDGNITAQEATKKEVHDNHLWHQEVAIFLINEEGKILLQRRSQNVHYNKGRYGMIANHVGKDQTLVDALMQKAEEEIGYSLNPKDIRYLTMLRRDEERERRFTYFYYIKTNIQDEDIQLNSYLATEKKWFDFEELKEKMLTSSEDVVFKCTPEYINIFGELSKIIKKENTSLLPQTKEFILIEARDGCFFPGVIQHANKKTDKIIIFIHGSGANFFKSDYYEDMYDECLYQNIDFMVVNNRGSEQSTRIHRTLNGQSEVIKGGTIYENFDESIYDIEAAVQYAKKLGYGDICLVGQSLGTVKVQYYCNMIGDVNKVILISPVDMVNRFRSRVGDRYDELVAKSEELVKEGKPYEMVTEEFSAIKVYSTMRINSKADILKMEKERTKNYTIPYKGKVAVIVGSNDHCYQKWGIPYVEEVLQKEFQHANFYFHIVPNANHMYKDHEKQLAGIMMEALKEME